MAGEVLSVELQARVDQFVGNLLSAANASETTSQATTAMANNISRNVANINRQNINQFTSALSAGTLSINRFNQQTASVASATRPLIVGSNQAAFALTNLGRVAQDAPFGFIGIQNNLNPLLESFQRLRAETGSNQLALKALTSSLTGPAGIGLALSVVGSAILFYQQYQQKANKALLESKKVTEDYIESLEGVEGAYLKGAQNAAKEISQLNVLYNIYQNSNIPLNKRKEAYREIQEQYPAYFKNIQFEAVATGKTTSAYTALTEQIIASAKARALSEKIGNNAIKSAELENKLLNIQSAIVKSRSTDTSYAAALGGSSETRDLLEQQKGIQTELLNIKNQDLRLQKEINKQVGENNGTLTGKVGALTDTVKVKPLELDLPDNPDKIVSDFFKKLNAANAPGALKVKAPDKVKVIGKKAELEIGNLVDITGFAQLIKEQKITIELEKIFKDAKNTIDPILAIPDLVEGATNAIGTSFEAMGTAIAEGGNILNAAGQVLQKSFADLLSALGQQFITMGAAKVAAGLLATPFGAKLVADGAGLIALGAGLKLGGGIVGNAGKSNNRTGGATAFANGGIISGPTLGLMGEYAGAKSDPEVVAPLSKLKKMLGQTDENGNAITPAGQTPVYVQQELSIDGKKLVALIRTVQDNNKRIG